MHQPQEVVYRAVEAPTADLRQPALRVFQGKMKNKLALTVILSVTICTGAFAGVTFNPTFTSNFTSGFGVTGQNAWIAAANNLGSHYSDNIHINITVDAQASGLGGSSTPILSFSYAALYNAILADQKSADDATTNGTGGSLGGNGTAGSAADPVVAGAHSWWATRAQAKAIGLIGDDISPGIDGTILFGTGVSYTFFGPIAPGTYDFQSVAAHEISEIMGRIGLSGTTAITGSPAYSLVDALSFSGPGARVLGTGGNPFFSMNAGGTLLKAFNTIAGADTRDWAGGTPDSFDAFGTPGVTGLVTPVDFQIVDVIGYDLAVPEPGTGLMLATALALFGTLARRR